MRFSALFTLLLTAFCLHAQPKQNSPYSRFGIGDPVPQYFASQAGMGGQAIASHDPFHLNLVNPASYAHLRSTALEPGLFAKRSNYRSQSSTSNVWSGNLAYFALGFTLNSPINEALDKTKSPWKFGMGFSLTPNSLVGYSIQIRDSIAELGNVQNDFQGNGGTYRLTWTNAVKYKNTAFGINLGWLFGKSTYDNTNYFPDPRFQTYQYTTRDELRANGLAWNVGLQHDFILRRATYDRETPDRWITVGLTGEGAHDVRITADKVRFRARPIGNGSFAAADTLDFQNNVRQTMTLPAGFGLGFQFVQANKWKFGAQLGYEGWSAYKNEARPENAPFRNTVSISAGFEFIPDHSSYNHFMRRVRYRAGAYYRQDPRVIGGKKLNDTGLSIGFGMPIILPRQQTSFVNAALEAGRLGVDSAVEETYIRLTLGFTLNDNSWFYKRRFE
jgi:long-subunit fatty acid transport protein